MNQDDIFSLNSRRIKRFEKIEGKPWGAEGAVIELAKQVGDLSALIMTREGYYFDRRDEHSDKYSKNIEKNTRAIADELADITFAVTRIAKHYGVDVMEATRQAAVADEQWFRQKGIEY